MRRTAASLIALTIALGGASSVLAQTIPVPEAARANPAIWPRAATPDAISDAQTDAFVTDLIRQSEYFLQTCYYQ